MPRISVITCVYNLEDIVLETVHSVLNQTYRDLELIITDDGSTDRTIERIESVRDLRMKLIRASHSGLPSVASNISVDQSVGEFIAITGADDVWLPQRLERQAAFLDAHPHVGMVHSGYHRLIDGEIFPADGRNYGIPPGVMPAFDVTKRLLVGNFICTPSVMLRRSCLDLSTGLYNSDPRICGPEDFDLWLRLAEAGISFGYIDEPLVLYRIRPDSVSRNRVRSLNGDIVALNAALNRNPQVYDEHRHLIRRRLAYLHRELAGCKFLGGAAGAWSDWGMAVKYSPLNLKTWSWGVLGLVGAKSAEQLLALRRRWMNGKQVGATTSTNYTSTASTNAND